MTKGNRGPKRGHRQRVGGNTSKGTIQRTVKLPYELNKSIQSKIKALGFSEYVRQLIEQDIK